MAIPKKEKDSGNWWSFLLSGLFFALVICFCLALKEADPKLNNIKDVSFWEFTILSLAVFRLTRLVVYDKVAQFIRDMFLNTTEKKESGKIFVYREKPEKGIRRLLADLLSCPWCTGVWLSVFSVFIYFMWPETGYFWILLAIAGVSTFFNYLQIWLAGKQSWVRLWSRHMRGNNAKFYAPPLGGIPL